MTYKFLSILLLSALPVLANSQDLDECALLEDSQSSSLNWGEYHHEMFVKKSIEYAAAWNDALAWLMDVEGWQDWWNQPGIDWTAFFDKMGIETIEAYARISGGSMGDKAYDYITDIEDLEECALLEDSQSSLLNWGEYHHEMFVKKSIEYAAAWNDALAWLMDVEGWQDWWNQPGIDWTAFFDKMGVETIEAYARVFGGSMGDGSLSSFIEKAKEDASLRVGLGACTTLCALIGPPFLVTIMIIEARLQQAPNGQENIHQRLAVLVGGGGALQGNNAFVNLPQAEPPIIQLVRERAQEVVQAARARQTLAGSEDVMGGWDER